MALFRRGDKEKPGQSPKIPTAPQQAYCRICREKRTFSNCWMRRVPLTQCECCQAPFEHPEALYKKIQPACPRCEEPLEQPGFEYGLCDGCGSKYELTAGTPPGLLPNKQQRDKMNAIGRSRYVE